MNKELPLVTILSPCYNHERYIIESLNSIKAQTYPNIEHVIIDDCSTDNSARLIEEWINANNYKCSFVKHSVNQGIGYTLNEGIMLANGKYWSPLATDDVMQPERTSTFVNYLEKNEQANMVVSDTCFINDNSELISMNGINSFTKFHAKSLNQFDYGTHKSLLIGNYIAASLMLRKSVFNTVGHFDSKLKMEDWDMWLKVSKISRIHFIDQQLSMYRLHGSNANSNRDAMIKDHYKTMSQNRRSFAENNMLHEFDIQIKAAVSSYLQHKKYAEIINLLSSGTISPIAKTCFSFFKVQAKIRIGSFIKQKLRHHE